MQDYINENDLVYIDNASHIYMEGSIFSTIALDSITLSIKKGEFIGIIGHTGSGKTTLVQHINALLKPTSGKIVVKGIDTSTEKSKLRELRQKIGLVFQYPEYQLFEETVIRDIGYGPKNLGLKNDEIQQRVEKAMIKVGLDIDEVGEKSPFELSGGQRRRVAFAGVLAMEPEVLILDEPTAGLDPKGRRDVLELLISLQKNEQISIIMISHYMDEIARVTSRILVMDKGTIVMDDVPRKIFEKYEELEALGLDVPYTVRLVNEMKKQGVVIDKCVLTLEELIAEIVKAKGEENA